MKNQKEMFFARKMDPCDYEATLAQALDEKDVVIVTVRDGKPKTNKKEKDFEGK